MKKSIIPIIIIFLSSCSHSKYINDHMTYIKNTNGLDIATDQFTHNIENLWGLSEVIIAGPKDYVKYTDNYRTRSHIDFDSGIITAETISEKSPNICLQKAIISTLLMSHHPKDINFYSDKKDIHACRTPFLYGQILDNYNKPIRWKWRATRFVNYLFNTHLKIRISGKRKIWSITIHMVPNHFDKRASKYLGTIRKVSQQYGVDRRLILAIMQTESSFNPYATSYSDALGLMQVVRHSAGRDVFKMKGKWGQPSRSYLFDPKNNIEIGTAYLSLLQNSYLGAIVNPISRRYAVIAAYNSGAGSVLRVFSRDQNKAFQIINSMHPDDFYRILSKYHPSAQSRRYLYKVNSLQNNYLL